MSNKILIIDDHVLACKVISRFLRDMGYDVKSAHSGNEGLEAASENYLMILLDLNLPDIQGIELAQRLRNKDHLKDTKIIVVTGDVQHSLDYYTLYGINGILPKPFTSQQISELFSAN